MTAHDLYLRAGMIRTVVEDIRDFLDEFAIYTVPADITFPDLVDFLGHAAAANAETDVEALKADIVRRETEYSMVWPDQGYALFHCKTEGVQKTSIRVCLPAEGQCLQDPYFQGIRAAILMLVPKDSRAVIHADVMSAFTMAFMKDPDFVAAVKAGDPDDIKERMAAILQTYLQKLLGDLELA
ncbi:MAG: PTS sugar transporter subunit IIA [Clostridia bacterium]|nr:PTS sugar transporter subunit IIA [Clostridia bacterium]